MARDLIAELQQKRASASSMDEANPAIASKGVLQASAKMKASKTTPEPDATWKSAEDTEKDAAEFVHRELDPLIFMSASQEAQDAAVESECEETVKCLQMINGTAFFCTSMAFNGKSLWKTTESVGIAGGPLYLFHVPVKGHEGICGWYIANHLFSSEKEKVKLDTADLCTAAWAEGKGSYPTSFHIPYWAKKPSKGVKTVPLWEAYLQVSEQALASSQAATDFKEHLDTLAVCLDRVIRDEEMGDQAKADAKAIIEDIDVVHEVRMEGGTASGSKGKGKHHGEAEHADYDVDDQPKGCGKSAGKHKGKHPRQHGGWMPKLAQLAASYINQDWGYCTRLVDRWCNESKTLSMLVDQKLKK